MCGKCASMRAAIQGLGEALACYFASHGARLILSSRRREALEVRGTALPCAISCHTQIDACRTAALCCLRQSISSRRFPPPSAVSGGTQEVRALCESSHGGAGVVVLPLDVCGAPATLEAAAEAANAAFDAAGVDYLVHNAGQSSLRTPYSSTPTLSSSCEAHDNRRSSFVKHKISK